MLKAFPIVLRPKLERHEHAALPQQVRWLIFWVALTAAFAAYSSSPSLAGMDWLGLYLMIACAAAAERFGLDLYGDSRVSISFIFLAAAAIEYDYAGVLFVANAMAVGGHLLRGLPWYKLLYNQAVTVLGGLGMAILFHALAKPFEDAPEAVLILPAAVATLANYALTTFLITEIIALTTQQPRLGVWREKFQWLLPHYVVLGIFGLILALAYEHLGLLGFVALLAPSLIVRYSMKQYTERTSKTIDALKKSNAELLHANATVQEMSDALEEAYHETLLTIVRALDMRDAETRGHSERVSERALAVAERLGVQPDTKDWRDLKYGALLHDVGKIAVPDAILHKTGPLTDEEWSKMREHAWRGYQMVLQANFLKGAAELIYSHHERFDGKGYPRGLAGAEIPLGARIFAVADAFDAMTSDRPYRKALPIEKVWDELLACSGTQFDPQVVQAFLSIYRRDDSATPMGADCMTQG